MIQEILHVSSRCGGGKSRETIKELVRTLEKQQPVTDTYLFASKTLELTKQNYENILKTINAFPHASIPVKRVDSTTSAGSVMQALTDLLASEFKGIIMVTHSTLANLPAKSLRQVRLVVDEVPQELAGCLMVKHDVKDQGHSWEKFLSYTATPDGKDTIVTLATSVDANDVQRRINDIRQGRDNTTTSNVADLLECLLVDDEPVFTSKVKADKTVERVYQCVHYHRLKKVMGNVSFVAILSAQLKETLFGFIAEKHLGLTIKENDINENTQLQKKHKNRVFITPFLKEGEWSAALRKKPANEGLFKNGKPVNSTLSVATYAQHFAESIFGSHKFLITLNQKEKMLESLEAKGTPRTSTAVHGMNNYSHLHHAAYLAATNPTPFDVRIFRKFAKARGLCPEELLQAIKVERCHEAAYQCIARISIRNEHHNPDQIHRIIVPDSDYADYLERWFEDGCIKILDSYSFVTKAKHEQAIAKEQRLHKLVRILRGYHKKQGNLAQLRAAEGLKPGAYYKQLAEFDEELKRLRLLPLKQKK
ncbi:hypothetical protein ACUN7Z_14130 [Vreelandella venusta]|uniref:hypothetical protein n=1 Tax=Vreelandella venusta TaxID=44935 RepID=UPI004044A6FF